MALRKTMLDLFIVAGELSGDLHGAELLREWKRLRPIARVMGVGGPLMRKEGLHTIFQMEELQVMGFSAVIKSLPKLYRLYRKLIRSILEENPKQVLLIDYAEFNMLLAKGLRKRGFKGKISQYVCPSVWAWRKGRIKTLEKHFDEIFCHLPFEPACFSKIPAIYVGHPLEKAIPHIETKRESDHIGIFPGSRTKEIEGNLALQFKVAKELGKQISIVVAHEKLRPLIESLVDTTAHLIKREESYPLMRKISMAIATSGTVTLELGLHGVPTVVTYAISPVDQFLATRIFKIDLEHYSLANLVAGTELFPELYGSNLTEKNLKDACKTLLKNNEVNFSLALRHRDLCHYRKV